MRRGWGCVQSLQLLTSKPALVVANVDEDSVVEGNEFSKKLQEHLNSIHEETGMRIPLVVLSASLEENAAKSESEDLRMELLGLYGLKETGLDKMIEECSRLLDLQCFYTIGPKEARAWKFRRGSQAVQCAGKIHSDIANGFISADVIKPEVFIEYNGEANVKSAGKLLLKGREYIVEDGDIIHFRFKKPTN
jgi:ribosome-binding ATPase YchF (GTP1/OBG family)